MAVKHYIRLDGWTLRYAHFVIVDTLNYYVDQLFIKHHVTVCFGAEYQHPDAPYLIIFCKVRKRDVSRFLDAVAELPRKMLLCRHPDCESFCEVFLERMEVARQASHMGDKLYRKTSIWNWLLIAFLLNSVRWLGIACCKSVLAMILFNIPAVTVTACFEFMCCLWLNDHVPAELNGSAQSVLGFISLGLARVIGSLLGGIVSDKLGIPTVFAFNGVLLLIAAIGFYFPTRSITARTGGVTLSGK
ncbi:MAG: MFS transporter [Eubacteriales bacterium]|nr:MFS transporter [Eubacteriales bacterium]